MDRKQTNEGWLDTLKTTGSNIGRGIAASRPIANIRAAGSNKSATDIKAKHLFMNKFLSHIDQAVGSFLKSRVVHESIELMTWRELDLLVENAILEKTKGASARGIKNRQNQRRPIPTIKQPSTPSQTAVKQPAQPTPTEAPATSVPNTPTDDWKSVPRGDGKQEPIGFNDPAIAQKVEPDEKTTGQDEVKSGKLSDITAYIRTLMYNNVLAGLQKTQFAPQIEAISSAIGAKVEKNPNITTNQLRNDFLKLGEVAWAAASASGANGTYKTPTDSESPDDVHYSGNGKVDATKQKKYETNLDRDFTSSRDMDDLESVIKATAKKYRRLGGSTANLDKIVKQAKK